MFKEVKELTERFVSGDPQKVFAALAGEWGLWFWISIALCFHNLALFFVVQPSMGRVNCREFVIAC